MVILPSRGLFGTCRCALICIHASTTSPRIGSTASGRSMEGPRRKCRTLSVRELADPSDINPVAALPPLSPEPIAPARQTTRTLEL